MPLYLVNTAVEMTLEVYVSQQLEEALTIQYERIKDRRVRETFVRRLETQIETLLHDSLDWDIKKPTAAQLSYAKLIATQVGVSLPCEAQKYRFHAAMFLETYAPKARQASRSDNDGAPGSDGALAEKIARDRQREDADSSQPS